MVRVTEIIISLVILVLVLVGLPGLIVCLYIAARHSQTMEGMWGIGIFMVFPMFLLGGIVFDTNIIPEYWNMLFMRKKIA